MKRLVACEDLACSLGDDSGLVSDVDRSLKVPVEQVDSTLSRHMGE